MEVLGPFIHEPDSEATTGADFTIEELDGFPSVSPILKILVPNGSLTDNGAGEVELAWNLAELREVSLLFSAPSVPAATAINIQTGVYAGAGSPATVTRDTNVTLPSSAAAFNDDGRIEITLNGQELEKGVDVLWVSTTQISISKIIYPGNVVIVKAPFPTS